MRRHYSQRDTKTGYEMILSEVSYNRAMFWLQEELKRHNYTIRSTAQMHKPFELTVVTTNTIRTGALGRMFYYDGDRGYLLGE